MSRRPNMPKAAHIQTARLVAGKNVVLLKNAMQRPGLFHMRSLAERFQQIPVEGPARPWQLSLRTRREPVGSRLPIAINWIYQRCYKNSAAGTFSHFAWISLAVIVASSLLAGWLLNSYCPEAAGSGIPQVKLAFWKEFGYAPRRIAWIKFIAGVVSIGGGQSLGREGPTVQIGANLASNLAGRSAFRNRTAARPVPRARQQGSPRIQCAALPRSHSCWRKSSAT